MRRYTLSAAMLLLAGVGLVTAQAKPDFSGERALNRQASTLSPAVAASVQDGMLRIQHDEPKIRVALRLVFDGKPFETVFERLIDGQEINDSRQGRRSVSSVGWDGDTLVFEDRSSGPNCETTLTIRYELQDGGRTIRATETIRGCGRDQDNVWVFERR